MGSVEDKIDFLAVAPLAVNDDVAVADDGVDNLVAVDEELIGGALLRYADVEREGSVVVLETVDAELDHGAIGILADHVEEHAEFLGMDARDAVLEEVDVHIAGIVCRHDSARQIEEQLGGRLALAEGENAVVDEGRGESAEVVSFEDFGVAGVGREEQHLGLTLGLFKGRGGFGEHAVMAFGSLAVSICSHNGLGGRKRGDGHNVHNDVVISARQDEDAVGRYIL